MSTFSLFVGFMKAFEVLCIFSFSWALGEILWFYGSYTLAWKVYRATIGNPYFSVFWNLAPCLTKFSTSLAWSSRPFLKLPRSGLGFFDSFSL